MFLVFILSCGRSSKSSIKVIYGDDNRTESKDAAAKFQDIANSSIAMIKAQYLKKTSANQWKVSGPTLGEREVFDFESKTGPYEYCSEERFLNQTAVATCSGVLIAKNRILTAGHCVKNQSACSNYAFVFNYMTANGDNNKILNPNDIYFCEQIIHSEDAANGYDFAIIETDRPVTGRKPMSIAGSDSIRKNTELLVVGHPLGLPLKLAADGKIIRKEKNGYYYGALDTYQSNSGSAIYDTSTKKIVGLLVSGDQDFELDGICMRSKKCTQNDCNGEGFTPANNISRFLSFESRKINKSTYKLAKNLVKQNQVIPDDFASHDFAFARVYKSGFVDDMSLTIKVKHPFPEDLFIVLKSNSGHQFTVFDRVKGYSKDQAFEIKVKMNSLWQAYRTKAAGSWSLIISDLGSGDEGKLIDARLNWRLSSN